MISEYDNEPIRGLPGELPADERIVWQGSPEWKRLAVDAFHVRPVAAYFAVLVGWAAALGNGQGALVTLAVGAGGMIVLGLLAWSAARMTVYTLTDKRIVLRIGVALPKCINLPLSQLESADLDAARGNIALKVSGAQRLGWIALWPHARPWRLNRVEPMLRALPDAAKVAALLARAAGSQPVAVDAMPTLAAAA